LYPFTIFNSTKNNNFHHYTFALKSIFILLFGLISSTNSFAQVRFYANAVAQNNTFVQLQLIVENGEASSITPPALDGLKVVQGPSTQKSISNVNGVVSSTYNQTYILQPTRNGKLTIGSSTAIINGKKYTSQPLELSATGANSNANAAPKQNQSQAIDEINESTLFARAELSKNEAYVGEQIVLSYKVYTRLTVSGFQLQKLDPTSGCWENNIQLPNDNVVKTMVNGKEYNCLTVKKSILIPQVNGEVKINPIELLANVRLRVARAQNSNSAFANDPFFKAFLMIFSASKPYQQQ
jgi:hypothetical protein